MIRQKQTFKKPSKEDKLTAKLLKNSDCENVKPISFNTKGYFSPDQPFLQEYLKVKQQVFQKYRSKDQELVVIDMKKTKPGAFIQRGCLLPNNHGQQSPVNEHPHSDKNYISRKQKKVQLDTQRFNQCQSQFRPNSIQKEFEQKNTKLHARSITSRISTTRSHFSNKENN